MTPKELRAAWLEAKAFLDSQSWAQSYDIIGSALFSDDPADLDIAVGTNYVPVIYQTLVEEIGWKMCTEYDTGPDFRWFSCRKGMVNLMVSDDAEWLSNYILAAKVNALLKLEDKGQRIAVCQLIRDKVQLVPDPWWKTHDEPFTDNPFI